MLDWFDASTEHGAAKAAQLRRLLFILPLALVVILLEVKVNRPWAYWHVAGVEDGPIEWLTAIIYFCAAATALGLVRRFQLQGQSLHAGLTAILALAMFLIGMEEISWGQRIFGIASPEFFELANRQQELNFHNLGQNKAYLDAAYLLVTFYALTARFWVPVMLQSIANGRFSSIAPLVSPPAFLAPYFALPFLLYLYYVNVPWLVDTLGPQWGYAYLPEKGRFMISRDQEPAECILALGFLFFTLWLTSLQIAGKWQAEVAQPKSFAGYRKHRYFKG